MTSVSTALLETTLGQFMETMPHGRFLLTSMGLEHRLRHGDLDGVTALPLRVVLDQLGADPETFLRLLSATEPGASSAGGLGRVADDDTPFRVEANVPCALKAPLEIALDDYTRGEASAADSPVRVVVQSENEGSISNQGQTIQSMDEMPDLTVAAGYNSLLDHAFLKRFATPDNFAVWSRPAVGPRLAGPGFVDPLGVYRAIGLNVFVFVVDPSRLGGRTAPDSWETLLADPFVSDVVVCGAGDKVSGSLLLHVNAHFGEDGVRRMGRNVKAGMHPSQVIKRLGTGRPECPAVAVMPYFFARLAGLRHPALTVWPRDGVAAMPFFMLVKRRECEGLTRFAAYLEGADVGRICSGAFFPSLHPDVPCPLPQEARLTWLGWDTIRAKDLAALRREAGAVFEAGRREVTR